MYFGFLHFDSKIFLTIHEHPVKITENSHQIAILFEFVVIIIINR